jgi:hypothetical protein
MALRIIEFLGCVHRPVLYITRKHNVLETGPVSAFRRMEADIYSVESLGKSYSQPLYQKKERRNLLCGALRKI